MHDDDEYCQYETEVVSCVPVKKRVEVNGKKVNVEGCEVVCKDTVLFPEGGGQNTDRGAEFYRDSKCTLGYISPKCKLSDITPNIYIVEVKSQVIYAVFL